WYLNHIFYGNNAYGVEAASRRYFGKHAAELSLAEATMLAGVPAAPSEYDPLANPARAKARQAEVLDLMVRHHMIAQSEADAAKAAPLVYRSIEDTFLAPHWVFHMWNPETGQGVLRDMCEAEEIRKPARM